MKLNIIMFASLVLLSLTTAAQAQDREMLAGEKFDTKKYDEAIQYFSKAISQNPTGDNYWRRGLIYDTLNEHQKAIDDYTKALEYYQNDNESLSNLFSNIGDCKDDLGKYEEAIEYYNKSIKLSPNWAPYWKRGLLYENLNEYQNAIDDYTKALEYYQDDNEALSILYRNIGDCIEDLGKYKEAIEYYNMSIEKKPNSAVYFSRALTNLIYLNNESAARPDFQKTLELDNDSTRYSAFAKCFLGKRSAGYALMKKIIDESDDKGGDFYNMACLKSLMGEESEALEYLDLAITNGFDSFKHIKSDDDLMYVKFKPGFKALLEKYNIPYDYEIDNLAHVLENELRIEVDKWEQKGEFESNAKYIERLNQRDAKIEQLTEEIISLYESYHIKDINWGNFTIERYDTESQSFKIFFTNSKDEVVIKVPIAEAPNFKANKSLLHISKQKFIIQNNSWVLSNLEIENPEDNKIYKYDITQQVDYIPNTQFVFNYDDVSLDISSQNVYVNKTYKPKEQSIVLGKPDVDVEIPVASSVKNNTYCLIIGNEDYNSYQKGLTSEVNVDYAINDAEIFKEYCIKTLGIPERHIKLYVNATLGQMYQGIAWLSNLARVDNGKAELIFYYSGHGLPDEQTKEPYLIPVDISGNNVKQGIKISDVYKRLDENPSEKVAVFLDACFSGGARNQGLVAMKGVKVKPKKELVTGNMIVLSSSTGEESSGVYREKQHGFMTYFLLKKLKETSGNVSYKELADYIIESVKKETALIGKIQTPQLIYSPNVEHSWTNWKLK